MNDITTQHRIFVPTNSEHSLLQVARHFRRYWVGNIFARQFLIFFKRCPQLWITPAIMARQLFNCYCNAVILTQAETSHNAANTPEFSQIYTHLHQESKNQAHNLLSMSSQNIDRFWKFFYWHTQQEICNKHSYLMDFHHR